MINFNMPIPSNYYGAEKIIIFFYFFVNLVTLIVMNQTGFYVGDPIGNYFDVAFSVQFFFCLSLLFYFLFFLYAYKLIIKGNTVSSRMYRYLELMFFVGTLVGWIGFLFFDYGKAEHQSSLSFGFIFRILPYDVFFGLYLACFKKLNFRSVFLLLFYIVLKLSMGWSGFFVPLFWILFIRLFNAKNRTIPFTVFVTFSVMFLFLLAPYIYAIKFYVRYGVDYDFNYLIVLSKLVSRLSVLPNAIYVYENQEQFLLLASNYFSEGFFFIESLFAILPRSLLGLGSENLETLYIYLVTGEFNPGVIFYLGFLGKLSLFYYWGPFSFLCFLVYSIWLLVFIFIILSIIASNYSRPISFYVVIQFLISGSMEELAYTLYGLIFLLFITMVKVGGRADRC